MSTICIRAQKSQNKAYILLVNCWVRYRIEQGDSTEQSPEIQLGCMRGLDGSEQPAPSEAYFSEVSSCIPKSLRASLSCVSGSLCSESEVEDITITGGSPSIDIVSSLQFSDAHNFALR